MHTLYVAAHGTAVALGAYVTDLQDRLQTGTRRRQPLAERPTALEITSARGMIARFDGFERLAAAYLFGMPSTSANPGQTSVAAPATRLETALAVWEVQAHRTWPTVRMRQIWCGWPAYRHSLQRPPACDRGRSQKRPYRRRGDPQASAGLDASQVAWNRTAKRWAELTNPASRTDPSLVSAASEVRAAIAAIATNQTGWATPDQLSGHIDLPTVGQDPSSQHDRLSRHRLCRPRHRVDHPGLDRSRAHHRHESPRGSGTRDRAGRDALRRRHLDDASQIAANQLIPLPEPARRGLINLADEVIASTNRAVAATAHVDPSKLTRSMRSDHATYRGHSFESLQITRPQDPAPKGPRR